MIPYGRQSIDDDDIAAVERVLKSEWLTTGPAVEQFEAALVERTGARHAVAFSSGTAALHAAAFAGELGPGTISATSPLSFVASANCVRFVGGEVTFVDIDDTLNLDLSLLPPNLDGLVAVHFAGLPVDLRRLPYRPRVVIEDAAHAIGASTPDGPIGACTHSDMCVFSFHPVKAVTTGEGGAVTTNSTMLAERLRLFRNHGIVRTPQAGGWSYEVTELGFNYRLTDMQAALGSSQLTKLERFVRRRNEIAQTYRQRLVDAAVLLPPAAPPGFSHAYHLFPIRVTNRRSVYEALQSSGIGCQVHYVPIFEHPIYRGGSTPAHFPNTQTACAGLLSIPLFPDLLEREIDQVVEALCQALGGSARG